MGQQRFHNIFTGLTIFIAGMFIVSGCVSNEPKPMASLDNHEHHVYSGLNLFQTGEFIKAKKEFILAFERDPEYSRAFYGKGLVKGYQKDFNQAFVDMKAEKHSLFH